MRVTKKAALAVASGWAYSAAAMPGVSLQSPGDGNLHVGAEQPADLFGSEFLHRGP